MHLIANHIDWCRCCGHQFLIHCKMLTTFVNQNVVVHSFFSSLFVYRLYCRRHVFLFLTLCELKMGSLFSATESTNTKLKSNLTFELLIPKWLVLYYNTYLLCINIDAMITDSYGVKKMWHGDLCQVALVPFQIA